MVALQEKLKNVKAEICITWSCLSGFVVFVILMLTKRSVTTFFTFSSQYFLSLFCNLFKWLECSWQKQIKQPSGGMTNTFATFLYSIYKTD